MYFISFEWPVIIHNLSKSNSGYIVIKYCTSVISKKYFNGFVDLKSLIPAVSYSFLECLVNNKIENGTFLSRYTHISIINEYRKQIYVFFSNKKYKLIFYIHQNK